MNLAGKSAVVTGSGQGLGFAYARALASAGASVIINDVNAETAEKAVASINADGGTAVAVQAAVGSTETADLLVQRCQEEFGSIDILVANAGILRDGVIWKMTADDFDAVIGVHLRGTFTCAKAAATAMRAQGTGGRVILAGSLVGQRGNFGQANYAAAKAGIVAMAKTWALELAKAEITVNAIVPNAATSMTHTVPGLAPLAAALDRGDKLPGIVSRGLGFGSADDVAALVVFLASPEAAAITGQCIGLGGERLSLWTHPREAAVAFQDGPWSAERIAEIWPSTFAEHQQTYGLPLPDLSDLF